MSTMGERRSAQLKEIGLNNKLPKGWHVLCSGSMWYGDKIRDTRTQNFRAVNRMESGRPVEMSDVVIRKNKMN